MATCEFYILKKDIMEIAFGGWVGIVEILDMTKFMETLEDFKGDF